jgi:hypothetical protein
VELFCPVLVKYLVKQFLIIDKNIWPWYLLFFPLFFSSSPISSFFPFYLLVRSIIPLRYASTTTRSGTSTQLLPHFGTSVPPPCPVHTTPRSTSTSHAMPTWRRDSWGRARVPFLAHTEAFLSREQSQRRSRVDGPRPCLISGVKKSWAWSDKWSGTKHNLKCEGWYYITLTL